MLRHYPLKILYDYRCEVYRLVFVEVVCASLFGNGKDRAGFPINGNGSMSQRELEQPGELVCAGVNHRPQYSVEASSSPLHNTHLDTREQLFLRDYIYTYWKRFLTLLSTIADINHV